MLKQDATDSIIIIGAGGIAQTAHLPAYRLAGFTVKGIFDTDHQKAKSVAEQFDIDNVYASLQEAINASDHTVVFDLAVPASQLLQILEQLPAKSTVLLQKPMGENLQNAKNIVEICKQKQFIAGVNFQLRYAPFILKAKELIANDVIGTITDIDIKVNVLTPWHLWDFLFDLPRVEILYHSIHYIDLVRNLLGNPKSVIAKTIQHPAMSKLASVRSNICMDYGQYLWANIATNHCHDYGSKHQYTHIKIEGTKGAILIKVGLLIDYPNGIPDEFEYCILKEESPVEWQQVSIDGTWFPHAFIGSMNEMLKAVNDKSYVPDNHVNDCLHTMACVEAAYLSNEISGIKPESF